MKPSIEKLVEIKFQNEINSTDQNSRDVWDLFEEILKIAKKRKIWDGRIKKVIVSDDFKKEVKAQAEIWKIGVNEPSERGSSEFSRSLRNPNKKKDEYFLFFPIIIINDSNVSMYLYLVLSQMSLVTARKIIPAGIHQSDQGRSLNDFINRASIEWCKANYSEILTRGIVDRSYLISHDAILTAFKRKLKRILYRYNSGKVQTSEGLWQFWLSYYKSIETLFFDILINLEGDRFFHSTEDKEISNLIYRVTDEISSLVKKCLQSQDFDISSIKNSLIVFSNYFHISLIDSQEDGRFYIYFSKDPKDYFVDIVDTEPRMVCFLDILGFSDLINSYDDDLRSTALQDIQESFSLAKQRLFDEAPSIDKELIKHLRYQSFSDNICISIPYSWILLCQ